MGTVLGRHIFHDIKNRGYTGSRSNPERLLKVWREAENIQPDDPPSDVHVSEPVRDPDAGHALQRHLAQQEFGGIDDHAFRQRFAPDIDAVKNAIELPWSNGQAEGRINRLKMLKRAMYGRAGPELMKARMLPLNHRN